jgi:hypothetical protein
VCHSCGCDTGRSIRYPLPTNFILHTLEPHAVPSVHHPGGRAPPRAHAAHLLITRNPPSVVYPFPRPTPSPARLPDRPTGPARTAGRTGLGSGAQDGRAAGGVRGWAGGAAEAAGRQLGLKLGRQVLRRPEGGEGEAGGRRGYWLLAAGCWLLAAGCCGVRSMGRVGNLSALSLMRRCIRTHWRVTSSAGMGGRDASASAAGPAGTVQGTRGGWRTGAAVISTEGSERPVSALLV